MHSNSHPPALAGVQIKMVKSSFSHCILYTVYQKVVKVQVLYDIIRAYSWRSASIGLNFAAFLAG